MLAINNRVVILTGLSLFFAIYGYNINLININEPLRESGLSLIERGEALISRLREASDVA